MFNLINIIITLLIGALVGYIAGKLMNANSGSIVFDCLLGVGGSIVGGFIFSLLGFATTNIIGYIISSVVGAIVIILVIRALRK